MLLRENGDDRKKSSSKEGTKLILWILKLHFQPFAWKRPTKDTTSISYQLTVISAQ
jgi:hypothetical protein